MKAAFLGIDIGTSSCKALMMAPDGAVLETETVAYPYDQPQEGWSEQDPALWIDGAARAIGSLLARDDYQVLCVGLSGQMHGMTALDARDQVIRPAILWNDQRNSVECDEITALAGGLDGLIGLVNNPMLPGFTGGKIRWFQKHEPALFERAKIILNPKDYLRFRMTGEKSTEVSDASGTGLFDVANRRWSRELLGLIGVDADLLPDCLESPEVSGRVSPQGQEIFGIPAGTPVIGGGGDAVIQTLGSGIAAPGLLQTTIGTAGIVATALDAPLPNSAGRVQVSCNVFPDLWHCMGVSLNAGSALSWWRQSHAEDDATLLSFDDLSAQAGTVSPGCDGLVFVPYLMGERCPWPDPAARGSFVGLRSHHRLAHFHRSVFEGVVFSLRDMACLVDPGTSEASPVIHASGGGASSAFWNQLQADIFGSEVVTTRNAAHGGAFGAAMLAAIGAGHWTGIEDVPPACSVENQWMPDAETRGTFDRLFAIYRDLYGALKTANDALSDMSQERS